MKTRFLLALLLCLPSGAGAAQAPAATLASAINAITAQPRYAHADWGIAVLALDSGRTLYAQRADKLMQPASTAKLFTAALVLDTLDTQARLATRLLSAAPVRQGQLTGNLYLVGMGDPTLGTPTANPDWADDLAGQLAARGVHAVRGALVADASYFAGPPLGSGWEASDLLGWFAAPASALSVHENIVQLTVTPAPRAGTAARLDFTPAVAAPPLQGTVQTTAASTRADVNFYRAPGDTTLHAFGSLAVDATPPHYRLAIPDPARQAGSELLAALRRHGIRVRGKLRVNHWPAASALPAQARTLADVDSPPIADILRQGLKRSQNLYLQNLLQIVGVRTQANDAGYLSSADHGLHALDDLLARIGIPAGTVRLEEGTGLARADLVTPMAIARLLRYLAAQPYADQLRDMRDGPASDNVQAKTGSMRYVHSLAGYVTAADGEHLAFAIMLNNAVREPGAPSATRDIDAIVRLLADYRQPPR